MPTFNDPVDPAYGNTVPPDRDPLLDLTPQADVTGAVVRETPTSQGMMWEIYHPQHGVLALTRAQDAAELILTALADYVPPVIPQEAPLPGQAGWLGGGQVPTDAPPAAFEDSQAERDRLVITGGPLATP